jgi:hypothetical protein
MIRSEISILYEPASNFNMREDRMTESRHTTPVRDGQRIIGWVHSGGCQNPTCKKHIRAGLPFHATPGGFAVTLPCYHFATHEEATRAILAVKDVAPMCHEMTVEQCRKYRR